MLGRRLYCSALTEGAAECVCRRGGIVLCCAETMSVNARCLISICSELSEVWMKYPCFSIHV